MDDGRYNIILKEFGERLKTARKASKLSTRKLADLADVDFGNINEIENGKKNPTLITIVQLCEALKIDPAELFPKKSGDPANTASTTFLVPSSLNRRSIKTLV